MADGQRVPAEAGVVEQQAAEEGDPGEEPKGNGNPKQGAVEDRPIRRPEREIEGERAAVGEVGDERPEDAHRAEGDDEGVDLPFGDEEPVEKRLPPRPRGGR